MTPPSGRSHTADSAAHDDELRARARRQRRIDEVFGTVIPTLTSDESGQSGGAHASKRTGFSAAHYRENRPPHHGGP